MNQFHYIPLLVLLVWADATDVRSRRIPNWLTLSLVLSGVAMSIVRLGALSPKQASLGLAVGLGIGFALFVIGAWAAGDAKLLAGIGAWLGALSVVWITAGAAILGMIIALGYALGQGRLTALFRDGAMLGLELAQGRSGAPITLTPSAASLRHVKARTVPLAVPLLLSTVALLLLNLLKGVNS